MSRRERRAADKRAKADLKALALTVEPALCEAVLGHMRSGRYLDAQLCCGQALEASPENPELLHLMALVCFNAKQFDHAVEWASRAIRKDPKPAYLTTLGTTLLNLGRHHDALQVFDKAVQLKSDDPGLWSNFGDALVEAGRTADALICFGRAFQIDPGHGDAGYKSGVLLQQHGRFDEALVCFDACDRLQPGRASILQMRALVLHALGRLEESLRDNRRAHELDPENPYICNNLGHDLMHLGRHDEALQWFDRALQVRPASVEALNNKAFSLAQLHRFDEALAVYAGSKAVDPDHAETDWNLALLQMLTGNFADGWAGREARFKLPSLPVVYPKFPQPRWSGDQDIAGKTILLYADEGLGDAIQFARYVPMVASRGARVVLAVEEALRPLLSGLPGVAQCVAKSAALPAFDIYCPISSLPLAFRTCLDTIPAETRYLPRLPQHALRAWEDRLAAYDGLRVGLVWSGNPKHANDRNRSIPLRMLNGILDVDATFVSLQKDPKSEDQATLLETDIVDWTAYLTDFTETAALVSCLDLVITVDTSVAHLASALGKPTWILLPYTPDYRWLLGRDDSPWYPVARLFRQPDSREYGSVLDRVRTELAELVRASDQVRAG
jgi:tetratricopeptide (TPR) repeat protein